MQLKKYKNEINPLNDQSTKYALARKISEIKNEKLDSDYNRLGLVDGKNIYHYVTSDAGKMVLMETSYPKVDVANLTPRELKSTSFTFSDGIKEYKYTFGDSQLWMYFDMNASDTHELRTVDISILVNPLNFLKNSFSTFMNEGGTLVSEDALKKDYLYLPLYSYRYKNVPEGSGLNAWNANKPKTTNSTTLRPKGEAYIPIPKDLWKKKPNWVNPKVNMDDYVEYKACTSLNNYPINLHMPDGKVFPAFFGQDEFKALETKPQNILGTWILDVLGIDHPQREKYDVPAEKIVTMSMLEKIGIDSVKLWHEDPNDLKEVWVDFAEYGSFERFMNGDI